MQAVVVQGDRTAKVEARAIPQFADDEVLVRVIGVSLNPSDWKFPAFLATPGTKIGCDYSGIVERIGEKVSHVKIGDKIGGIALSSQEEQLGSFAHYVKGIADLTWKKPDHISHEENATFGVGCLCSVSSLFQKLSLPSPANPSSKPFPVLIWSGATSLGQYAIQLSKLSNLTIVTTSSPKNFELLKSLGADHVFDYNDPEVIKKIKEVTNNGLEHAFDCFASDSSTIACVESMGENGGKVVSPAARQIAQSPRSNVQIIKQDLYTSSGREIKLPSRTTPAVPEDRKFMAEFIKEVLNPLLVEKKIKPNVIKIMPGGLADIQTGLDYLRSGKASAEKLVYHVQDE